MNIATAILHATGAYRLIDKIAAASSLAQAGKSGKSPRYRGVSLHKADKDRFSAHIEDIRERGGRLPKHVGIARKAATGTLTLPHGRRGLMVRRVDGKLRIGV